MMLEHHTKPLLPFRDFLIRILRYTLFAMTLIGFSLGIGILGYHFLNDLPWIDALLNASMILTGMGPVDAMKDDKAKLFASFYAIYSGVAFLSTVAVFLTPMVHRFLHRFRLGGSEDHKKPRS
jgi:hypothetical protein